jgi:putative membrane-bound dehydrogenase-like protein
MPRCASRLLLSWSLFCCLATAALSKDEPPAQPLGHRPLGRDGQPLNLDFETGTLEDWLAEGDAFNGQPIEGDAVHARRADMLSRHQGRFWVGSFERGGDGPKGTLTSAPFTVTHDYATFLFAGGQQPNTRVELVRQEDQKVFYTTTGQNIEDLWPIVLTLKAQRGREIFIRLVDDNSDGWGHLNFDSFLFHDEKPNLPQPGPGALDQYSHAGLDPEQAAAAMTVPDGFQVTLFAGEPDVVQPIAFAFDDRGRMWVAEAYSYPRRVKDEEARDRILIFEDTDGDGRFDQRKVFIEKLNLVSGLALGFGGVWVGSAPHLLFIPDANGDDQPDGPPQILLDGWGLQDTHETLNTFIWGPDGWLYGCHGVFTHSLVGKPGTPKDQRVAINAGIWRYQPTRHEFEVFAHGTSNPWGVDFDDRGQAVLTACVIPHLFHVIQGGRYHRQAGEHFNKHTYQDIKTIADHVHWVGAQPHAGNNRSDAAGGGHAHAGAMIYLGDRWPAEYRNQIFMNNIHGARINLDLLEPQGSGLVGRHGKDFLAANDIWSQILNLQTGPDGQVYMIDWYDKNQCHRYENHLHDRSNGRIFKVSYRPDQQPKQAPFDLAKASDDELVEYQLHPNDWYVRHARRILQERGPKPAVHSALASMAQQHSDPTRRLRALWALHATGGLTDERVMTALGDADPYVRGWAIQLACETGPPSQSISQRMVELASSDPSQVVRLYLASAAQKTPLDARWPLLEPLVMHSQDADDHNLPLMFWYALEPLVEPHPDRALTLAQKSPLPQLLAFTVRRAASTGDAAAIALLVDALRRDDDFSRQLVYLNGLNLALKGRRQFPMPKGWSEAFDRLVKTQSPDVLSAAQSLAVTFGDARAMQTMRSLLTNGTADLAQRQAALTALLGAKDASLPPLLKALLDDAPMRAAAIRAMAAYDDTQIPELLVKRYAQLPAADRRDALNTLASRASYAQHLLTAIDDESIPRADISADIIRQLRNLNDKPLLARVQEVWGIVRETAADKAKLMEQYRKQLTAKSKDVPDVMQGRAVFAKTCAQCHKLFGAGGMVGPELTGSNRADLEYLLSNVLDPSAVMAKEYQPTIVITEDGRVITGIVKAQDDQSLTLVTANETVVLPKSEIEAQEQSAKSMMPDDLLSPLTPADVKNLVAYLAGSQQVPLPATRDNANSFFNGKDLSGWQGDPELWTVEEGELVGRSAGLKHNEFLSSDLSVGNFRLELDVKLVDNRGNSGIQFRSRRQPSGEVQGYQADIGENWWGKLYEELGRGLLWDRSGEKHVKSGDWNRYTIEAVDGRIRTWINGELCVDMDDPPGARQGIIAFQLHSGDATEVRFRNMNLEIDPSPSLAQQAAKGDK